MNVRTDNLAKRPALLALPFVIALLALVFVANPATHRIFPRCLFHELTGWNCPGCGSTRATHELLHGHIAAALRDNALLVCAVFAVTILSARCWILRRRAVALPKIRGATLWILFAAVAAFTVARNLPGGEWLSP
jgi:hypothetical protein